MTATAPGHHQEDLVGAHSAPDHGALDHSALLLLVEQVSGRDN